MLNKNVRETLVQYDLLVLAETWCRYPLDLPQQEEFNRVCFVNARKDRLITCKGRASGGIVVYAKSNNSAVNFVFKSNVTLPDNTVIVNMNGFSFVFTYRLPIKDFHEDTNNPIHEME